MPIKVAKIKIKNNKKKLLRKPTKKAITGKHIKYGKKPKRESLKIVVVRPKIVGRINLL